MLGHVRRVTCLAALLAGCCLAQAQTAVAPSPPAGELSPAERAKRDAESVFRWITIHSDKPRKPKAEARPETKPEARTEVKRDDKPAPAAPRSAARTETAAAAPPAGLAAGNEADPSVKNPAATAPTRPPATASPAPATQVASLPPSPADAAASAAANDDDDDAALVPVKQGPPEFPGAVMRQLRKGLVQVRFDVLPDGSVGNPEVVKTSNRRLNETAVAAVAQ